VEEKAKGKHHTRLSPWREEERTNVWHVSHVAYRSTAMRSDTAVMNATQETE